MAAFSASVKTLQPTCSISPRCCSTTTCCCAAPSCAARPSVWQALLASASASAALSRCTCCSSVSRSRSASRRTSSDAFSLPAAGSRVAGKVVRQRAAWPRGSRVASACMQSRASCRATMLAAATPQEH